MKNNIEFLTVDYYEVCSGWIFFNLTIGQQTFEGRFSNVFDSVIDFKKWLEAISIGVQQTSFIYDSEGYLTKFNFESVSGDKEVLTISDPKNCKVNFVKAYVDRTQIVKAFYHSLLDFANSDIFQPDEWELQSIKERLCINFQLDEPTLISHLIEFNRKELITLIFKINPQYIISFPKAKDKNEEIKLFIQSCINSKDVHKDYTKKPIEVNIPNDYDSWTRNDKEKFINECLKKKCSAYNGTNLTEFRSLLIEKYLTEYV